MSRGTVAALLAAGGLALTASLYLPWERLSCPSTLRGLTECRLAGNVDGWSIGLGAPTALFSLAVVGLAAMSIARPSLFGAVLGQCALSAGYFGLALAIRSPIASRQPGRLVHGHYHAADGMYIGIAATALLLLGAWATPLRDHVAARPGNVVTLVLAAGLLAAFLLPWLRFGGGTTAGVQLPAGVPAAALASVVPLGYWRKELPLLGAAVFLVTGGAFASVTFPASRAFGTWVGLGLAAALAATTFAVGRAQLALLRRSVPLLLVAPVCIASLFLPWQRACYPGRCLAYDAWPFTATAAVALLVLALLLVPSWELAAAAALFVATLGFSLVDRSELGQSFGYGSYVGFASFAALLAIVLVRARPGTPEPRIADCVPGLLLCAAYVVLVLLPTWHILSPAVDSELRLGPFSWLTVAGVLVAVHLFARWARRARGLPAPDALLVVLPLVLLALAALDLIRERESGLTWGGGGVVGICFGLAALGAAEVRGGLRAVPLPEILRVDRIP